jgi:transposase
VLFAADGLENKTIAAELEINEKTVGLWRRRFAESGLAGIEKDAPRAGRRATVQYGAVEAEVIRKTTQEDPPNATHWSTRTMAAEVDISPASIRRIWKRNGLKPHLHRTFKVSNDPRFAEKLDDIVGLYLNPPEKCRRCPGSAGFRLLRAIGDDWVASSIGSFNTCVELEACRGIG